MKRLISITLSLVMILSLAAGLDFGALAVDEPNGIAFELAGPLYAYKDSDSHDVNGFNAQGDAITYPLYEFSVWDLVKEGNVLKLSYDDGTTVDYTCSSVYQSEGNYYTLKFINDFGETIDTGDLSVRTDQGPDNPWQTGETYDLVLTYKEDLEATVPVHVRENPVESISVEISAPLRLIEGQNCHEEYDEEKDETWFNYTVTTDYLKYSDAVIMVNYSDGRGTVVYLFRDNDWKPYDENGVSVDEDYFRLDFDQWRNHFGPDAENKACVSYYGKTFPVAVDVLDVSEIDEGEVDINGTTRALFAGSEIHTFSITAEETGVYLMEGSLGDKLMGTNEYEFSLFCGEEEVEPLSQEKPIFLFEAGREYTFTVSKISDGSRIEKISFSSVSAVTGMSFTPAGGAIEVYEGDYPDVDNLLYSPGNTLELSFSNGETKTFVCDEEQTFFCSEDEISLWEYCDSIDLAFDADLRCEANYEPWECGRESKLTVTFANASLELSVTVVPSPFASISFTPAKPFEVFEGLSWQRGDFNSEGEWVVYDWYDFSAYDLFKGGNVITVTNYDGSTEDYTYGFYYDEEADRSYDAFISEAGNVIFRNELYIRLEQGPDHQWTAGNSYPVQIMLKGRCAEQSVVVKPCPVDSILVDMNRPITLFNGCQCYNAYDWESGSDYFRFYERREYLLASINSMTVNYNDGRGTVTYHEDGWSIVDENDDEIDEAALSLRFDIRPGVEPAAYVSYYGVRYQVPVQIMDKTAIDDGSIELEDTKPLLLISDETHSLTFTPQEDGAYVFSDNLAENMADDESFEFCLKNSEGVEVQRLANRLPAYMLTGGETYTFELRKNDENALFFGWISVRSLVYVSDLVFEPIGGGLEVFEGETWHGRLVYERGNKLTIVLSDGRRETFVSDGGRLMNDDDCDVYDFLRDNGIQDDFNIQVSHKPWVCNEDTFITISIGETSITCPVTVKSSAVESIEYTPIRPIEVYSAALWTEEFDGVTYTDINGSIFSFGDVLTVRYDDGRGTVRYVCTGEERFVNENDEGDVIFPTFRFVENRVYSVGDNISFTIGHQKGSTEVTGTIVEFNVESIAYVPASPYEFEQETNGEWRPTTVFNEETGQYEPSQFFYYWGADVLAQGSTLTLNFKDGSSKTYVSDGTYFRNENDSSDILHRKYIVALWEDPQYFNNFLPGKDNKIYVRYYNANCPVPVTILPKGDWEPWAEVITSRNERLSGEDATLVLHPGEKLFVTFGTGDDNAAHGVTPFLGFSDGYAEGTLKAAGFTTTTGLASDLGYQGYESYAFGLEISAEGMDPGDSGVLYYYLYELPEGVSSADGFDWVNTPKAATFALNVVVRDHNWEQTGRDEASCTSNGKIYFRCNECGATREDVIPALGHDMLVEEFGTQATCTEDGTLPYCYCRRCGNYYIDSEGKEQIDGKPVIKATGHDYKDVVTVKATLTKDGKIVPTCSVCGDKKAEKTIAKASGVKISATSFTYNGKAQKPTLTVKDSKGKTIASKYYTATWSNSSSKAPGKYTVKVTFKGNYSGSKTLTYKILPRQVTGLKASKVAKDSITLTWTKRAEAKAYKVEYSSDGSNWKSATVTTNTYTLKSLKAGSKWQFRVKALDSTKKVAGKVSATLKTGTLTAAPKISKLTSTKSKTATVTWGKVTGAKSYIVFKSTDNKNWDKGTSTTKTTLTLSKLTAGKKIYVKVVAVNAYGKASADSAVKSVTVKK